MTKINLKSLLLVLMMLCINHLAYADNDQFFSVAPEFDVQFQNDPDNPWTITGNTLTAPEDADATIVFTNNSDAALHCKFKGTHCNIRPDSGFNISYSYDGIKFSLIDEYGTMLDFMDEKAEGLFLSPHSSIYLRAEHCHEHSCPVIIENVFFYVSGSFTDEYGSKWNYLIDKEGVCSIVGHSGMTTNIVVPSTIACNNMEFPVEILESEPEYMDLT